MRASERFSNFNSRRTYTGMVIPFQIGATTKWSCSNASSMGLKALYTALLILAME
jgi:hypothetical protein